DKSNKIEQKLKTLIQKNKKLTFFFKAEDSIRDFHVTGVQTCALPIYDYSGDPYGVTTIIMPLVAFEGQLQFCVCHYCIIISFGKIGRASCRERMSMCGGEKSFERN